MQQALCKALQKKKEFKGKTPIFILATRGVEITEKLRKVGNRINTVYLNGENIDQLITLSKKIGKPSSAMTSIFRQEIFRGGPSKKFLAIQ